MVNVKKNTGKAKAVLVFGQGDQQTGVISSVVARATRSSKTGTRVQFSGPALVCNQVRQHIEETVLAIVDRVLDGLQLPRKNYDISVTNLSAASAQDIGLDISGYSADLPVLLAMLSAALQLPIPDDIVTTGHIASVAGDITAVKAIPAKVEAVVRDKSVGLLIYPDLNQDRSLETLSPDEHHRSMDAFLAAKNMIQVYQVRTVFDLVERVFSKHDIALVSLCLGFYQMAWKSTGSNNLADEVAQYLARDNQQRVWVALEEYLSTGHENKAGELLASFIGYHIDRQVYASSLGQQLRQLILSLPPATRRMKITFPLVATSLCIELSQFAQEGDYDDVCVLFEAAHGRFPNAKPIIPKPKTDTEAQPEVDSGPFDAVISLISEAALAQKFYIPIDSARGSFILEKSTVASWDQFEETLVAFFIHLQRHLSATVIYTVDHQHARTKALALLDSTFQNQGGRQQAVAQAIDGTRGGIKSVLDALTEQFKREEHYQYIQRVFTDALSPLDWEGRVAFMRAALHRLNPFLPDEIKTQPPERFAHDYEVIVKTFVQSFDRMNQLLRTL